MRNFLFGMFTALIVVAIGGFTYVRLGFVDPRADIPVNRLEETIAMPSLDASVDRHAPEVKDPVDPSDANLIAGMQIYEHHCASCHGDIDRSHGMLADDLYPRAPQFVEDASDMPEYQNFYIIEHGVRLSGMPAWNGALSLQQMWQVTTFLAHMDKLPPAVRQQWKAAASRLAVSGDSRDGAVGAYHQDSDAVRKDSAPPSRLISSVSSTAEHFEVVGRFLRRKRN